MKKIAIAVLSLLSLLTGGCAEKSEEQQLASIRSSVLSASYQFTSDQAVKLGVSRYNGGRINEKTAHGLLGLLWLVKNKPQLACLEADTFSELNKGRPDNLSLAIRTVAFRRMNWTELSAQEYAKLKANLAREKERAADNAQEQKTASTGRVLVAFNLHDDSIASDVMSDGDNIKSLVEYVKNTADAPEGRNSADNAQDYRMALIGQILVGLDRHDDSIALESAKALDALGGGMDMKHLVDIAIKARDGSLEPAKQKLEQLRKRQGLSEQKKAILDNVSNILMQLKPGRMSEQDVQQLMNLLANSVVTDMLKGSKFGAILNRL